MKKVLLIQPPFYRLIGSHFNSLMLGLCYVASTLNKNGHKAAVFNADYLQSEEYANQRQIFEGYDSYKEILNDLDHPIWKEIEKKIREFEPDFVGVSMLTATYRSALNIAKITKEINGNIQVVVGGTHPTILPYECLEDPFIDYAVMGEGEQTFLELLQDKKHEDIKGLVYRDVSGEVRVNESRPHITDLDLIPFPERDLILNPMEPNDYGAIITSRGCPFECTFCVSKRLWNRKVRFRSVQNVFDEVKYVKNKYGTNFFNFRDDTLTLNVERIKQLCRSFLENGLDITWTCDTRVDRLDKEALELMKKAGCKRVKIGVESGNNRILRMVKKGVTKEQIRQTVKLIKEVGLEFTIYLMIGFPTETEEEARETLEFAKELGAHYYSLSICAPYYGTQIYSDFERQNGNSLKKHWEYFFHQSKDMILNDGLSESLVDEFLALNEGDGKKRI